jgi:hypothetical protein
MVPDPMFDRSPLICFTAMALWLSVDAETSIVVTAMREKMQRTGKKM